MSKIDMKQLGLNDRFLTEATLYPHLYIGRVASQYKDLYKVICENGELLAEVSGKLRFEARALSGYPAVGDFVMLDRDENTSGNAIIHTILTRKSAFIRKAAGTANNEQIVASNIDIVFICMSLNNDFNIRRLERYLSIAWDSRAKPVIVLTKSDLCENIKQRLSEVETVAIGADIIITSAVEETGYLGVMDYIGEGQTIAFIGSSGVGKSSLINRLIGDDKLETKGLRNDDKGRHTTTRRELIVLSNGGVVIDTPGMRELGIESADLTKAFADIDELAAGCKFSDCTHKGEPGCAIQSAIENGVISADRFHSYQKLKIEAGYDGLSSKQIENTKINRLMGEVGGLKGARKFLKETTKGKNKF